MCAHICVPMSCVIFIFFFILSDFLNNLNRIIFQKAVQFYGKPLEYVYRNHDGNFSDFNRI